MDIKPIPTSYNGYLFRSRLEARWAVFFDTLGIKYRYEVEGFVIGAIRYLPDFWLEDQEYWIEVKPKTPNPQEILKAGLLSASSGQKAFLLAGDVWEKDVTIIALWSTKAPGRIPWYVETAIKNKDYEVALAVMEQFPKYFWEPELRVIRQYLRHEYFDEEDPEFYENHIRDLERKFSNRRVEPYYCSINTDNAEAEITYQWVQCSNCYHFEILDSTWIYDASQIGNELATRREGDCSKCKKGLFLRPRNLRKAYENARRARFEHNETPKPRFRGRFRAGEDVYHTILGEGTVVESRNINNIEEVTIWFYRERKQLSLPEYQIVHRPRTKHDEDIPF